MDRFDSLYMKIAYNVAELSYCKRRKVGAVIVSPDKRNILSYGYNGTPYGFDNNCEDENNQTHDHVIHAEMNAVLKLAKDYHGNANDAIMYCTTMPCEKCAASIIQSGIKTIIYEESYHCDIGVKILEKAGIKVIKYNGD